MQPFLVKDIQSVDIGIPDLAAAERFYTEAWGLEVAEKHGEIVYLRAGGREPFVLALHARPQACILRVTFSVAEREALGTIAARAMVAGATILEAEANNNGPEGGVGFTLQSPEGFVFRFLHGAAQREVGEGRHGFPLRLSHVNLNCADIEATRSFFERGLGMQLTDRSAAMAFLRTNADHHVVVLADSGIDGLNHIAFLMPDFDALMRGVGRMADYGYPVGWGVGRHGPGDNIFAYFVDPFGIVIEHTSDVLQVDESYHAGCAADWTWPPGRTDQWGACAPKAEAVKKAQLAIRFESQMHAGVRG